MIHKDRSARSPTQSYELTVIHGGSYSFLSEDYSDDLDLEGRGNIFKVPR